MGLKSLVFSALRPSGTQGTRAGLVFISFVVGSGVFGASSSRFLASSLLFSVFQVSSQCLLLNSCSAVLECATDEPTPP